MRLAERIARKIVGALLSKGEPLGKGGDPGTPRGVPVKSNGGAWIVR